MPVILPKSAFDAWLDPKTPAADLHALLAPFPPEAMTSTPVSALVNSVKNDVPACLLPEGDALRG